jgi:uncharacterized protein DUF4333
MSLPARAAAVVAILITGLALTGCGDTVIDAEKAQDAVQHNLETSLHEKIASVSCPSDRKVEPGTTFTCSVDFADGRQATATLKILNKDADVSFVGLKSK